jgi:hypothetical protein
MWSHLCRYSAVLAMLSNVGNAARNVAMKGCIARGCDISSHVTLCLQSLISLVILLAVFVPLRIAWGAWDANRPGGVSGDGGGGGRVALTPGCQIGYMEHARCHQ